MSINTDQIGIFHGYQRTVKSCMSSSSIWILGQFIAYLTNCRYRVMSQNRNGLNGMLSTTVPIEFAADLSKLFRTCISNYSLKTPPENPLYQSHIALPFIFNLGRGRIHDGYLGSSPDFTYHSHMISANVVHYKSPIFE